MAATNYQPGLPNGPQQSPESALLTGRTSAQPDPSERRRYRRIPAELDLIVRILTNDEPVLAPHEPSRTVNISPGDAFFRTSNLSALQVGTEVALSIDLPLDSPNIFTGKHLEVNAEVVRIEDSTQGASDSKGVAVRFLHVPRFANDLD